MLSSMHVESHKKDADIKPSEVPSLEHMGPGEECGGRKVRYAF